MNVVACYKVVPDIQDISVLSNGSVSLEKATKIIGEYDLVAIEEAVRLAEVTEGKAFLLSAGGLELEDSKLLKGALSRGAEGLYRVVDESLTRADSFQAAAILAAAIKEVDFDLVICGEGSADLYSQQVGILLGELLSLPVLNAVSSITAKDGSILIERELENEIEVLEVQLPAVISVTTSINLPRIPQLKDILAAGKKPVQTIMMDKIGDIAASNISIKSTLAPENIDRKQLIYETASDDNIAALASDIKIA